MNRRGFLGTLLAGAVAAAMPHIGHKPVSNAVEDYEPIRDFGSDWNESDQYEEIPATIGDWHEYSNFSTFAVRDSIDEVVHKAAEELGYQAGQSVNALYKVSSDHKWVALRP